MKVKLRLFQDRFWAYNSEIWIKNPEIEIWYFTHSILDLVELSQQTNDVHENDCKSDDDHCDVTAKKEGNWNCSNQTFLLLFSRLRSKKIVCICYKLSSGRARSGKQVKQSFVRLTPVHWGCHWLTLSAA